MRQKYISNSIILILIGLLTILISGCCEEYVSSEMEFSASCISEAEGLHITSSSPIVPIAGNKERIVYIDLKGNIVCYDCATSMEKTLVKATSKGGSYTAGTYYSIILDGNKVYYRVLGQGQWDTIYCVEIDSCRKQKIGKIYMDSPFYIQDGIVYGTGDLRKQLNTSNEHTNDPLVDYYFKENEEFIVSDRKVYQAYSGILNIFDLDSEWRAKIPYTYRTKLFFSNQNDIYYAIDTEFGEIKDGAFQKVIDLKDFDVTYGYTHIQIVGKYIIIGNDVGNYIYNKDTNSLEAWLYGGNGPFYVNGELIYKFETEEQPFEDCFKEIGQGYYSLDIEKAIEDYRED